MPKLPSSFTESQFSDYAEPQRFISAQATYEAQKNNSHIVILGALNPSKTDSIIAGSHSLWRSDYTANHGQYPFGGMKAVDSEMAALLGSLGVTPESTIIVYGATTDFDVARLYWQLKEFGHQSVRMLEGGLKAWIEAGLPTQAYVNQPEATVTATTNSPKDDTTIYPLPTTKVKTQLATLDMVVSAQSNDDWVIIDVRSPDEVSGKITMDGAFGPGAIPSSVNINWNNAINLDYSLKSPQQLSAIYSELIKGKKVITYCQSGVRAAFTAMVLSNILGAEHVYNYDGSWIEYSYAHYIDKRPDVSVINNKNE